MPRIQAFQGLRYSADAGAPDDLVAPPYDVIDDALRADYLGRSPHNVVHATLPEPADPADPESRYPAAKDLWARWKDEGVVKADDAAAIYVLTQRYTLPDGRETVRTGLMTRMRLHHFEEKVVLPHERILSAPFEDRLKLTLAVRTQLEPIFLVFSDAAGTVREILARATAGAPLMEAKTDDGVVHGLYAVTGEADVAALSEALAGERALIADGHHRYQTALGYREKMGEDTEGPHQWVMSFLCPLEDEGLVILPTHRLVHSVAGLDADAFLTRAEAFFEVTALDADPRTDAGRAAVAEALEAAGKQGHALAAVTPDGRVRLLVLRDAADLSAAAAALPEHPALRQLDVTVLHGLLLQHLLGLSPESQERKENLEYFKSGEKAYDRILAAKTAKEGQLLFVMNATPMEHVRDVADAGLKMPQKSTYFFPKLPSGMLFNPLD